jgi:phytanoyl-CoA hydroxylase
VSQRLSELGAFVARRVRDKLARRAPAELPNLWPMQPGAYQRIALAVARREVTLAEASRISHFAEHGYVILSGAVEPALADELVRDVRSIAEHPGCFVTTDHRNARAQRLSGADFDAYESVYDTYVNFESARRVAFHPAIARFLTLVFDTPPVAFQQLLFQRSNQHPLHQDTSVVCTEQPLFMAASWVALEDVVPGRGELTYYAGSHRIPHYRYRDGSKRFNPHEDDAEAARRYLLAQCAALGCEKRDFIAKKGDVFVWAADLVHGSNPRTLPEHETRLSVVTHYCPTSTEPYWFRFHRQNRALVDYQGKARYASAMYRLPIQSCPARPNYELPR